MTYVTSRCPHCRNIIDKRIGTKEYMGNPIRACPYCGGLYIDTFTQEWIMKSPWKRFKFFVAIPFCLAFFAFIIIFGILMMRNDTDVIISLVIGGVFSIIVFVFGFFSRKKEINEEIKKSLQRTKNAKYVKKLLDAGIRLYPVQGVEIGTDCGDDDSNEQTRLQEQANSIFTLH